MAKMLKAIHAQESKKVSREKAAELRAMKLKEAAKKGSADFEATDFAFTQDAIAGLRADAEYFTHLLSVRTR